MNDFDVLVPTGKLEPALTALRAIGWTPVALPNGRGFSRGWVADAAMSLSNKLARLWFWNWRLRGHAPSLSTAASFPGFLRRYTAH